MSRALAKYDAACRAVAEAKSLDEAKGLRDKAAAMAAYARQAKNKDLEADAIEIRLRAERRAGEMLRQMEKNKGAAPGKTGRKARPLLDVAPKLSDFGVSKSQSSKWQKLAAIPASQFEGAVAHAREAVTRAAATAVRAAEAAAEAAQRTTVLDETCTIADLGALGANGKRFGAILADPPWSFRVYSGKGKARSAERHFDTMSLDDIKALPVSSFAADNCALFLWSVMPQLPEALDVIRAWGFEYKTCGFCWVKQNESGRGFSTGMGYWTRANAELCLLATRGSPQRLHKDVHELVVHPLMEHSRKPGLVHERIERLVGGPYLEMFGRRITPGWTVWGNEIERRLFDGDVREVA